ncbi:MAG: TetR family transcriptional regulator [Nocardioides sp.]|nr:TetR family transcriptional regulator [Nocardioides sp.]
MPTLVDRTRVRDQPTTARGIRTRESLVAAARRVFERDGYLDARLVDITAEAGCSVGTFYTYFDSKEEVFTAVIQATQDDMMHPGLPHVEDSPENTPQVVRASNRAYFEAYKRNARLMGLLEQVATIDPAFRELRLKRSRAFADRNARKIAVLQEQGYVDPTLDPSMAALAVTSMISRMGYSVYVLGQPWEFEALVDTATALWLNALGIPRDGSRRDDAH